MKLSVVRMAKTFGQMGYIRGLITYQISSFEQRAFAGFSKSIVKTLRRMAGNALTVVPPFAIGYLVYTETEKEFHRINRKNPADYANDK